MSPRVSIVVPTHDTCELTLRCLASLRAAVDARGRCEVIVVDDGSRDDTASFVEARHPEVTLLRIPESVGFARAINRGVAAAHGEFLFLLNSDTEIEADAIARCLERFDASERIGIVGAELVGPDDEPQWSGGREPSRFWLFVLGSGLATLLRPFSRMRSRPSAGRAVDWVSGAAMAIRRETWTALRGFDESFRFYAQDLDFCSRARAHGWRIEVAAGALVRHHLGATIRRRPGTASTGQHPELLWTDLVRWTEKRGGPEEARAAARAMQLGGRLRLFGRLAMTPFVRRRGREVWRRDTAAYAAALAALGRFGSSQGDRAPA